MCTWWNTWKRLILSTNRVKRIYLLPITVDVFNGVVFVQVFGVLVLAAWAQRTAWCQFYNEPLGDGRGHNEDHHQEEQHVSITRTAQTTHCAYSDLCKGGLERGHVRWRCESRKTHVRANRNPNVGPWNIFYRTKSHHHSFIINKQKKPKPMCKNVGRRVGEYGRGVNVRLETVHCADRNW